MSVYIVAFEVNSTERKDKLKEKLRSYGTFCPINDNCWAIVSSDKPIEIRNNLDADLIGSDRIFVIRSGTSAAWRNAYGEGNSKWLKERL